MGKIVMPKNSALLEEVEAVLKIYYNAGTWLSNDDYKKELKAIIGSDQYSSSYTKKAQITSYFGFTEWEDISNVRSLRRITKYGKKLYEHLSADDQEQIEEDLMIALEKTTFGRNNFGCPDSNSDVEPPAVFVRASCELGYLTYKEFAYLLWKLEDCGGNYTEAKEDIIRFRNTATFDLPQEAQKYTDAKPIMVLIRWGFLQEKESSGIGGKHIAIKTSVLEKYKRRIQNLKIYNIDKDIQDLDDSQEERKVEMYNEKIEMKEVIPEDLTVEQLGELLSEMYNRSDNKTTAIHMFGIKYGPVIKKNNYTAVAIVAASSIGESYHVEVSKGLRIYESILNNQYGIKFYDPSTEKGKKQQKKLPVIKTRKTHLYPLNCIMYGAPGTGKTYSTAQYALAIVENQSLNTIKSRARKDTMKKYNDLLETGQIVFTTFHQNYGYEDFIQGIRPDVSDEKEMRFKNVDGIFKTIADRAMLDSENNYVIIIDEINRANISKVFGELITLIEDDKRWGEINAISAILPSGEIFAVPNNLYIIGTMNSADKSISLIDTALRRRFEFIEFVPKMELVADPMLRDVLTKLNDGIFAELNSPDLLIGHSYFIEKQSSDLCDIMNRSIIPLLYEYFFDNQKKVKKRVEEAIDGKDVKVAYTKMGRIKLVNNTVGDNE